MVEGIKSSGKAIPVSSPKLFVASAPLTPDAASLAGITRATKKPVREVRVLVSVIGEAEQTSGRNCFTGFATRPLFITKVTVEIIKETTY